MRARSAGVLAAVVLTATAISLPASATGRGPDFSGPVAIASDGAGHLWVANSENLGVTEVNAASGAVMRIVRGPAFGFNDPNALAVDGANVWVVSGGYENPDGSFPVGALTEFRASDGSLRRWIDLSRAGGTGADGVVVAGPDVWLSARGTAAQLKIDAASGTIVSVFHKAAKLNTSSRSDLAFDGAHIWLTQWNGVVELDPSTGQVVHSVTMSVLATAPGVSYKVPSTLTPVAIAFSPGHVWAANDASLDGTQYLGGSVADIDPATDKMVRLFTASRDKFENIQQIVVVGRDLWVLNGSISTSQGLRGATLTELDSRTGQLVRIVNLRDSIVSQPVAMTVADGAIWVVDDAGGGVTPASYLIEVDPATGAIVRRVA